MKKTTTSKHLAIAHLLPVMLVMILFPPQSMAHAPHDVVELVAISPDFPSDQTIFAVFLLTDHTVMARSQDGGRSWMEYAPSVLGSGVRGFAISPGYASDGTLFAATRNGGVWRSVDCGLTWEKKSDGLTTDIIFEVAVSPDFVTDHTLLAATEYGLFRSVDRGESWERITSGLADLRITVVGFAPADADIVFCGGDSFHISYDKGSSWNALQAFAHEFKAMAISPNFDSDLTLALAFRTAQGIAASTDGGLSWFPSNNGLTDFAVNDITIADDGTVFAVTSTDGCFRANPLTTAWTTCNDGFEPLSDQTDKHYRSVVVSPDFGSDHTVFVGAFEGFFKSTNKADLWSQGDIYNQLICRKVKPSPAYAEDGLLFVANYGGGPLVYQQKKGKAPGSAFLPSSLSCGSSAQAAGNMGVKSGSIQPLNGRIPKPWTALADQITSLHSSTLTLSPEFGTDQTLFYGYQGLWRSENAGKTWEEISIPIQIPRGFTFSPGYGMDNTIYMGSGRKGTYVSADGGYSWTEMTGGLPSDIRTTNIALSPGFVTDRTLFISTSEHGLWRSYDAGVTWSRLVNGLSHDNVRALAVSPRFVDDGQMLAGTVGEGLYRSTDRGDSWYPVNDDFPSGSENIIDSIVYSPDYGTDNTIFAVSFYDHVFRSYDQGLNWHSCSEGLPPDAPREIAISPSFSTDKTVFLSTHNWMWRSRNGGDTWSAMPGYNRVDDRYPSIRFQGNWRGQPSPGSYTQQISYCKDQNAYKELEFYGNSIEWIALLSPDSGIAEVFIDNESMGEIDLYSAQTQFQVSVFEKPLTQKGWHTIRITVTGTKNPLSTDLWIRSDGFAYTF